MQLIYYFALAATFFAIFFAIIWFIESMKHQNTKDLFQINRTYCEMLNRKVEELEGRLMDKKGERV